MRDYFREVEQKADEKPDPDEAANEAKLQDWFRVGSGLLYTQDVGTKQVTLGFIYWNPRTSKKVKDPKKEKDIAAYRKTLGEAKANEKNLTRDKAIAFGLLEGYLDLDQRLNRTTVLKTVRTLQNGEEEGALPEQNRWSLAFGTGADANNKYVVGLNYMLNEYVGLTVAAGFSEGSDAKGRLTFGLNFDGGVLTKLLNPKGKSDKQDEKPKEERKPVVMIGPGPAKGS